MPDSQKFVLMFQPSRLQGFIWKSLLKSQGISVIWESLDTDLKDNLTQIKQAGLTLPHLLIVDVQNLGDNPYAFCRWCRDHLPEVKVMLTHSSQRTLSLPERDWAVQQGAADLLPGFQRDNLVSSATAHIKRALEVLDIEEINDGAMISVLLKLKRELEARQDNPSAQGRSAGTWPQRAEGGVVPSPVYGTLTNGALSQGMSANGAAAHGSVTRGKPGLGDGPMGSYPTPQNSAYSQYPNSVQPMVGDPGYPPMGYPQKPRQISPSPLAGNQPQGQNQSQGQPQDQGQPQSQDPKPKRRYRGIWY